MRLSSISMLSTLAISSRAVSFTDIGLSEPNDVGMLHTDAFVNLADMHSVKRPANRDELMKNTISVMTSFCDPNDAECHHSITKKAEKGFDVNNKRVTGQVFPYLEQHGFDPRLVKSLEKVDNAVHSLNDATTTDVDNAFKEIEDVWFEVENMQDVHEPYKTVVLGGISVASESSQLWHGVYNDPSHVLYGMHASSYYDHHNNNNSDSNRRRRQQANAGIEFDITAAIIADIEGAIEGALQVIIDDATSILSAPLNFTGLILGAMLGDSVVASAAALVGDD